MLHSLHIEPAVDPQIVQNLMQGQVQTASLIQFLLRKDTASYNLSYTGLVCLPVTSSLW